MKRVIFERSCLFTEEETSLEDHKIKNIGRVIISEKKDRLDLYVNNRDLRSGVVEVLDCLAVTGYDIALVSELSVHDTKEKIERAMIDQYIERCIGPRSIETFLKECLNSGEPEDFTIIVCQSEELVQTARKYRLPTIRVLEEGVKDQGPATLAAEKVDQVDDIVFQAEVLDEVSRKIRSKEKCRLIGIDGIELVGKSYFSKKLASFLAIHDIEATIVRLSDFKSAIEVTYKGEDETEAFYFHAFNYNKILDELIKPFLENGRLDIVLTSFGDALSYYGKELHYKIEPGGIMILEGELMYREPLIDYFDCMIYLYMEDQEAMHRALVRDLYLGEETKEAEFKHKRLPAHKMYMARHVPLERSDFAIDNTNHRRPMILRDLGGEGHG
ncbi:MAG: hypothetical protein JW780_03225 [Clostridiales bacterium]|nr:hypothetical protein [Clostridiales bacterium]